MSTAGEQGAQFAAYIQEELTQEYSRRESVNSRAAAAITSATGLVTVVLAVIAVLKGKDFTLTGWALRMLFLGVFGLLAAAVLAVLAGMTWGYKVTDISTLRQIVGPRWRTTEVTARSTVAQFSVKTIATLRYGNGIKFRLLLASGFCQVAALLALGATALIAAR
jgi:Na+/melibiose symporter-like transporter